MTNSTETPQPTQTRRQLRRRLPPVMAIYVTVTGTWDPTGTWCPNVEYATVQIERAEGPTVTLLLGPLLGQTVQWPEIDAVALEHLHALGLDEVDEAWLERTAYDPADEAAWTGHAGESAG